VGWGACPIHPPTSPNLLQGVAEANYQLLTIADYDTAMNRTLAGLGVAADVDRVYIFQHHAHPETGEPAISQRFEWVREGIEAQIDNPILQNLTYTEAGISRWYDALPRGNFIGGTVRDFPPTERDLLSQQDILALLVVPIQVQGEFWGFIGFDDCQHYRRWSTDETTGLMTIAASIGLRLERQQTDEQLQREKARYLTSLQQLAANVPGVIYQFQQLADGRRSVLFASSGCRDLFELEPEAIEADFNLLVELLHPDDRDAYEGSVMKSADTLEPWQWEGRAIVPSGKIKWIKGMGRARKEGENLIWDGVLMDISDRACTQEQLEASEERLQSFFNATFEAVIIHQNGKIVDLNPAAEFLFGYTSHDILGQSVLKITAPESRDLITEKVKSPSDEPFKAIAQKKDGTPFHCEVRAKTIFYQGNPARVVSVRDISEVENSLAALRESEAKNRALLDAIPDLIFRFSADGTYLDFKADNPNDLVVEPREIIGQKVEDLLPESVAKLFRHYLERAIATREPQIFEYYLLHPTPEGSQQRRDWEARVVMCGDREVLAIVRDISDRKHGEQLRSELIGSLQQARDRLQAVLDAVPGSVAWISSDLKYLGVNKYLAQSFQMSPAEFVGQNINFINFTAEFNEFVRDFFASNEPEASQEVQILTEAGICDYLIIGQKYNRGAAAVFVGFDITERKGMEEALRVSEEKFSKAFRSCPDAMTISSLKDGRYIDVNQSCLRIFGYERDEIIGRQEEELHLWVNEENRQEFIEGLERHGSVYNYEVELLTKSGELRVGLLSVETIEFDGEPCVLGVMNDITERKRAEAQLREKEAQYRSIFEATSDGLVITDLDGYPVEANPAAYKMHGYSYEEFLALSPEDYVHPDYHYLIAKFLETLKAGGEYRTQSVHRRKDGTGFYIDALGTGFIYKGEPHILGVVRDITDRVRAEEKLRASAQRDRLLGEIALRIRRSLDLQEILNTTVAEVRHFLQVDRVCIGQLDGRSDGIIVAESVAEGYKSLVGAVTPRDIYLNEVKEFLQVPVQVMNDTRTANLSPYLKEHFREYQIKSGLAVRIVVGDCLFGLLVAHQCDRQRQWQASEIELLERLATQVAIAIQQGQLYQQLADLNANLERQVEDRTQELRQAVSELEELHQLKDLFLHAVTHDLRTPVMGTLLLVKNLLQRQANSDNPQAPIPVPRSTLERTIQGCDRQLTLINSLLEVHASEVRGVVLHREPTQLQPLVRSLTCQLHPLLEKNDATLTTHLPEDLPAINADPAQLWRVFENAIVNALTHNPPGVQLTITVAVEDSQIRCAIGDNGVGMTPEQCETLFELYARGPNARRFTGLGLGLYLCRQIVTAHGGEIGVNSTPGEGSTFWFTLPLGD
jgi:PAS domain S-box-containing protein